MGVCNVPAHTYKELPGYPLYIFASTLLIIYLSIGCVERLTQPHKIIFRREGGKLAGRSA